MIKENIMQEHPTELVWYEDGVLYTQKEYLTILWSRAVSSDEAMSYCKKKQFVQSIISYKKRQLCFG